jgi:hypothetical protein
MGALSDTLRANQQLMAKVAEAQIAIGPVLNRLANGRDEGYDEIARAHLRNIELLLNRMINEAEQGRVQTTAELRSDLKILTRTIAAVNEDRR